ncbi:MAG: hypothetical protein J0M30_00415 [Chitinophagales bacterium]|nr:hypothetical protein [Chitinophagales bacterium]
MNKNFLLHYKVLFLGIYEGRSVYTLTKEKDITVNEKPSESYLGTIGNGIQSIFNIGNTTMCEYFITKKGAEGNYTQEQLNKLFI